MADVAVIELTAIGWSVLLPGVVAVVAVSMRLSLIDWREHRLPNNIVGPLAAGVAIWLVVLGVATADFGRSLAPLGWGFAGLAAFLGLHFVGGLGMGDVKYAWPVCATLGWFGWSSLQVGLYGLAISGGIVALIVQLQGKGGKHRVAYGPYMALGLLCGIARGILG